MIVSKSVEYEKAKFAEFLENLDDGLATTRQWLVSELVVEPEPCSLFLGSRSGSVLPPKECINLYYRRLDPGFD